ncbi:MAG: hypothetical protein PHP22_03480 [Oscillospiraceae bacterium]|nr:hypothetical protein [Oscillospiraceae bacterium]
MKTSRIKIRNLFGITETELSGQSVEITGPKGAGKTSVLDAIRLALTNRSDRDYIIHQGATEGEILIETDTGLSINRKIRTEKADSIVVKNGTMTQNRPAEFLNSIFTPLQLNPVDFTQMSRQEKNRVILNLIEFEWDTNWIQEKFGEIPKKVDYSQHILQVLHDIQAIDGDYYTRRQDLNREEYYKRQSIEDIAKDIPAGFQYDKWKNFDLGSAYRTLETNRQHNAKVESAKNFISSYEGRIRELQAKAQIAASAAQDEINSEDKFLAGEVERLKAELKAAEEKRSTLGEKLANKKALIMAEYEKEKALIQGANADSQAWAAKSIMDTAELSAEIEAAETMRKYLSDFERIQKMNKECEELKAKSEELTSKITLARELPGEILKTAKIPIDGLTVEEGIPLINGLPISNLSDGETLDLCVDITIQKPGGLQIILIDGAERLDAKSRAALYQKCKDKGLTLIATRVTDSEELEITEL